MNAGDQKADSKPQPSGKRTRFALFDLETVCKHQESKRQQSNEGEGGNLTDEQLQNGVYVKPAANARRLVQDPKGARILQMHIEAIACKEGRTVLCRPHGWEWDDIDMRLRAYASRVMGKYSGPEHLDQRTQYASLLSFAEQWSRICEYLVNLSCEVLYLSAFNGSRWDFIILEHEMKHYGLHWPDGMEVRFVDARQLVAKWVTHSKTSAGKLKQLYQRHVQEARYESRTVQPMFHTAPADVLALKHILFPNFFVAVLRSEESRKRIEPLIRDSKGYAAYRRACYGTLHEYLKSTDHDNLSTEEIMELTEAMKDTKCAHHMYRRSNVSRAAVFTEHADWFEQVFIAACLEPQETGSQKSKGATRRLWKSKRTESKKATAKANDTTPRTISTGHSNGQVVLPDVSTSNGRLVIEVDSEPCMTLESTPLARSVPEADTSPVPPPSSPTSAHGTLSTSSTAQPKPMYPIIAALNLHVPPTTQPTIREPDRCMNGRVCIRTPRNVQSLKADGRDLIVEIQHKSYVEIISGVYPDCRICAGPVRGLGEVAAKRLRAKLEIETFLDLYLQHGRNLTTFPSKLSDLSVSQEAIDRLVEEAVLYNSML